MTCSPPLFLFITVSSLLCSFCAVIVCNLLLCFTWKRKWQLSPVFLPGKSHGQEPGRLQSIGSQKRRTQPRDWTTTLSFYPSWFHMYSLVNCWSVSFSHSVVIQSFILYPPDLVCITLENFFCICLCFCSYSVERYYKWHTCGNEN